METETTPGQNEPLKPAQALALLSQATEPGTKITRRDCVLIEHALEVIAGALAASEETTFDICE